MDLRAVYRAGVILSHLGLAVELYGLITLLWLLAAAGFKLIAPTTLVANIIPTLLMMLVGGAVVVIGVHLVYYAEDRMPLVDLLELQVEVGELP